MSCALRNRDVNVIIWLMEQRNFKKKDSLNHRTTLNFGHGVVVTTLLGTRKCDGLSKNTLTLRCVVKCDTATLVEWQVHISTTET